MKEILPGIWHWTRVHEKIRIPVHSCYLEEKRVLIDPMAPKADLDWFRKHGPPEHVLLTNRHHYRHSGRFQKAFGVTVHCHREGLHEFTHGERVEPFEFGDELPGGILALEVGVLCPEETALYVTRGTPRKKAGGAASGGDVLAFGDALIRDEDGKLGFVPDQYMGEDPKAVKRGLKTAFRRLAKRPFEHLLMAHGEPIVGKGKKALERFLA
jgi:hypothetical protein